jgi:DNA-binding transcriptional regulator YiaG
MTIKELREAAGMSRKQFADYFEIEYRRVQNWELNIRNCPEELLRLMQYKLEKEGLIK